MLGRPCYRPVLVRLGSFALAATAVALGTECQPVQGVLGLAIVLVWVPFGLASMIVPLLTPLIG